MRVTQQTVNIRPSARILKVLGDIEFEPWQCIAELVDNSFDDFLEFRHSGRELVEIPRVDVRLPLPATPLQGAEVVVEDNGRGMDLETLNKAVRAGWSSNDPFSKLGLFGMGFNVATARLGSVARILTTREGDTDWVGIEIDLDSIGDDFDAPVIVAEKSDISSHGTRVAIGKLNLQRGAWLQRNAAHLRTTLGAVYSYLLDEQKFDLLVNDVKVKPRRPCMWDVSRSVTYGSGQNADSIPAIIQIDRPLPAAEICMTCRNWQEPPGLGECKECHSTDLVFRPRRIHGWLGIQRYLHRTDYGIDFLRNGRKILRYDKRLFDWKDPNDPVASTDIEYPVELGQGGRIIGEIHLDHVPVNYHKDAFEWNDRSWLSAVNFLRGPGPLLPRKAQLLGYPENGSALGRLHRGFRRNDAGLRCLVPGDGQGPIHEKTREWAENFYAGDPDYQSDNVWWQAVLLHEREKARREQEKQAKAGAPSVPVPSGSVLESLGLSNKTPGVGAAGEETETHAPPKVETEQERLERYRLRGIPLPSLTGDFGLVEMNRGIKVRALDVKGQDLRDSTGSQTPVLLVQEKGGEFTAFVDAGHRVFQDFPGDASDLVMFEVANHLKVRSGHGMPLAEAVALLKIRHLNDYKIDQAVLVGRAQELLRGVRERMSDAVKPNPERAWQHLNPDERSSTESTMVSEGSALSLKAARESGEFVLYAPAMFIPRLIEEWPEAFLDGAVFRGPYKDIASVAARRVSVGKIAGYLYDAARLVTAIQPMSKDELVRARYTLQLLESDLAAESSEEES
jgi:hypothetical protein